MDIQVPDIQVQPVSIEDRLAAKRGELQPLGKTKVLEVEGYDGLLGIKFGYINSEITEKIARKVAKQTRTTQGIGSSLLGSIDTILKAEQHLLVRDRIEDGWRPFGTDPDWKEGDDFEPVLLEDLPLRWNLHASTPREAVMAVFGSDHSINQMNVQLSLWLTNVTREGDADFIFG